MKRLLALLLAMVTVLGLFAGCGEEKKPASNNNTPTPPQDLPTEKPEEVRTYDTVVQEALAVVAEAYYARRTYVQYEDNPFIKSGAILRADRHKYSPEDATSQFTTYSNCAAFTYDVYKKALGLDIICWTTSQLQGAVDMHALTCNEIPKDDAEQAALRQQVIDTLQPGDIINYRKDSWGHAMLYIGYDEIIHCSSNNGTGGSYNMATNTEVLDPSGGIYKIKIEELFAKHLDFDSTINAFAIVRPTLRFTDAKPTDKTLNRIANLQKMYVEKTADFAVGMTVAQGEDINFNIQIKNSNKTDKTLELSEVIPANTTYVSGADKVEGNTMKWTVTVPASGKVDVKYVVKVNADAKTGDKIASPTYVGGVEVRARDIYIGGHLSAEEQKKIYDEAAKISGDSVTGVALAKKIYSAAGIACNIGTEQEIISSMFKTTTKALGHFELNTTSEYMKMLAPTMYGGYLVYTTSSLYDGNRTKGPLMTQLMAGDIVVCKEGAAYSTYLFVGQNKAMSLNKGSVGVLDLIGTRDGLFSTIGHDQFVVLRPAMA